MRPLSYQVENLTADLTLNKSLTFALNQKTRWSESHVSFEDYCLFRNCTFVPKKCHTHKYPDFWLALKTQKIWYPCMQQTMEHPEVTPPDPVGVPCSPQFPTLPIASGYSGFCGCFFSHQTSFTCLYDLMGPSICLGSKYWHKFSVPRDSLPSAPPTLLAIELIMQNVSFKQTSIQSHIFP